MSGPRQKALGGLFKNGKYECSLLPSPAREKAGYKHSSECCGCRRAGFCLFVSSLPKEEKSSMLVVRKIVLIVTHTLQVSTEGDPGEGNWSASWPEDLIIVAPSLECDAGRWHQTSPARMVP